MNKKEIAIFDSGTGPENFWGFRISVELNDRVQAVQNELVTKGQPSVTKTALMVSLLTKWVQETTEELNKK